MDILLIAIWFVIQAFLFSLSIWFVVFGLRTYNFRLKISIIFFILGFFGLIVVVSSFYAVTNVEANIQIEVTDHDLRNHTAMIKEPVEPPKQPLIELTDQEFDLLARLVEAEARGEPYEGKVAVALVVLNRILNDNFPNDLKSVIYQKRQFSPVVNGAINNVPSEDSRRAAWEAVDRINNGERFEALYFCNPKLVRKSWLSTRTTVTTIGNHVFKK